LSSATIGASQTITIGAGGTAGTPTSDGGNGGTTSFGAIFSATGGLGGAIVPRALTRLDTAAGRPGNGVGGDINIYGSAGKDGTGFYWSITTTFFSVGGDGGSSYFAPYKSSQGTASSGRDGIDGNLYGGGAVGAFNYISGSARNGASGAQGIAIITEFIQ